MNILLYLFFQITFPIAFTNASPHTFSSLHRVNITPLKYGDSCTFNNLADGAIIHTYNISFSFNGTAFDKNNIWNHTTTCNNLPGNIKKTQSNSFIQLYDYQDYNHTEADTDWQFLAKECLRWSLNTNKLKSVHVFNQTYHCATTQPGSDPLQIVLRRMNFVILVNGSRYNSDNLLTDSTHHSWYIPINAVIQCKLGNNELDYAYYPGAVDQGGCFDASQDDPNASRIMV